MHRELAASIDGEVPLNVFEEVGLAMPKLEPVDDEDNDRPVKDKKVRRSGDEVRQRTTLCHPGRVCTPDELRVLRYAIGDTSRTHCISLPSHHPLIWPSHYRFPP